MKHYPCTHAVQNRKQSMRRTTMNWSQFQRRTSLALCFLALAAIAYGQAQQGAQFEPQVGQAGKDVVWVPTPQELVNKMLDLAKVTPQDYLIDHLVDEDRKSTRLNSSHRTISYAVFCLKKKMMILINMTD